MEEETSTIQNDSPEIPETQEELSKMEAITGIFTEPGNTFETINKVSKNYWILPMIIAIVLGLITSFLFFSDNELVDKTMDKQRQKVREKMEESVKQGKMSQEQSREALEKAEKFMNPKSLFFQIIGYLGGAVTTFITLFLLSLVYLVFLKILKAQFNYMSLLNVIGLAMIVSGIGGIINIVLSIVMGDLSSLGLGLVLNASSVGTSFHGFLSKIDVFNVWFYVIISIGLIKVAKIKPLHSYLIVFGVWFVYLIIASFVFNSFS
jgi:hypothetical protein